MMFDSKEEPVGSNEFIIAKRYLQELRTRPAGMDLSAVKTILSYLNSGTVTFKQLGTTEQELNGFRKQVALAEAKGHLAALKSNPGSSPIIELLGLIQNEGVRMKDLGTNKEELAEHVAKYLPAAEHRKSM